MKDLALALEQSYLTILAPPIRHYITEKETEKAYPLEKLNDMRALINFSTYYINEVAGLLDRIDVASWIANPLNISSTRCIRIHMACLLSLAIQRKLKREIPYPWTRLLEVLTREIVRRCQGFPNCDKIAAPAGVSIADRLDARHSAIRYLGILLRELADKAGLGEHPLYILSPTIDQNQGLVIQPFFYQRLPRHFPHRVLIGIKVEDSTSLPAIRPFRGSFEEPIHADNILGSFLMIDHQEANRLADAQQVASLAKSALLSYSRREQVRKASLLDVRKMIKYTAEIRSMLSNVGRSWRPSLAPFRIVRKAGYSSIMGIEPTEKHAPAFLELIDAGLHYAQEIL